LLFRLYAHLHVTTYCNLQKSSVDGTPPRPNTTDVSEVQEYVKKANPTWTLPEKRRLQKFVKRATSKVRHQHSTTSSTPTSESTTGTSDVTDYNELDNKSERSRSSRLKGITSRLFGNGSGSSNRNVTPVTSVTATATVPIYEIQTTAMTKEVFSDSLLPLHDPVTVGTAILPTEIEIMVEKPQEHRRITTSVMDKKMKPTFITTTPDITMVDRATPVDDDNDDDDVSRIYKDDNDGTTRQDRRCCFFF
jgi:hypothetical protein